MNKAIALFFFCVGMLIAVGSVDLFRELIFVQQMHWAYAGVIWLPVVFAGLLIARLAILVGFDER